MRSVGEGRADFEDDPLVQRAARNSLLQGLTLEQLHDDEGPAIGRLSNIVDRADIGMLQGCHRLRFAPEPLASLSRIGGVRRQHLDGLAHRGAADAVDVAPFGLVGQQIAGREIAAQNLGADILRQAVMKPFPPCFGCFFQLSHCQTGVYDIRANLAHCFREL